MDIQELGRRFDEYHRETSTQISELRDGLERGTSQVDSEKRRIEAARDFDIHHAEHAENTTRGGRLRQLSRTAEAREARAELAAFARRGQPFAGGERRDMLTAGDGGLTVPMEISAQIANQLIDISPVRSVALIERTSTQDYRKVVNLRGTSSGWEVETAVPTVTSTPSLGAIEPEIGGLFAMPAVSQWMIDDSQFDIAAFLIQNIADEFAFQEGVAFISGNGIRKPTGFLSNVMPAPVATVDDSRDFGTLQYVPTGAASALSADSLIDTVHALRPSYRQGPGVAWMMNSTTASEVRKLKDGDGQYLWANSLVNGQPPMLLGYPVVEAEAMPGVAGNAFPIAFGNWPRGYLIVDRMGVRMGRDEVTVKGQVLFYTTKRLGGSVLDSNALKLLKIAAS